LLLLQPASAKKTLEGSNPKGDSNSSLSLFFYMPFLPHNSTSQ
jgi:hypothetical protein